MTVGKHSLKAWVQPNPTIIPPYDVERPGETKYNNAFNLPPVVVTTYSAGFESGLDGWTGPGTLDTTISHAGTQCLRLTHTASGTLQQKRTIAGLTVGRSYTAKAWMRVASTYPIAHAVQIGVTGKGSQGTSYGTDGEWVRIEYSFAATVTTHELYIESSLSFASAGVAQVDDITLTWSDFETPNLPGWSTTFTAGGSGATSSRLAVIGAGNPANCMWFSTNSGSPAASPTVTASRTFTGLVVGRRYLFDADVSSVQNNRRVRVGVGSTWSAYATTANNTTFAPRSVDIVATGTSLTLNIESSMVPGNTAGEAVGYVDNVRLIELPYTETIPQQTIPATPIPLDVIEGSVTLDDSRWPYAQASFQCYRPTSAAALEQIDPRKGIRTTLEFGVDYVGLRPDMTRTANMLLRSRTIDDGNGTMTVFLTSDEMALADMALVATQSERVYGLSVKTAVDFALAKIGKTLAPGWTDANIVTDALPPVATNMIKNGSFSVDATGWTVGAGVNHTSAITAASPSPVQSPNGNYFRVSYTGTHAGGPFFNTRVSSITGNERYRVSAWMRSNVAARIEPNVEWFNGATNVGSTLGTAVTLVPNVWTRVSHVHTSPGAVTSGGPYWYAAAGFSFANGNRLDIDGVTFTVGDEEVEFFEGSTASTGLVTYAWTGAAYATASTRTYLPNTDAMILDPGETLWDYLAPILDSSGLRLWCDELGLWRLRKRDELVAGQVNVSPTNGLIESVNSVDRDGDLWFDSVVIKYADEVFDIAGVGGKKTLVLDRTEKTIPAFGGAQAILATALARGRSYTLAASSNYESAPGKQLVLTIPGQIPAAGALQAVSWEFPAGTMTVDTKGIVETPLTSWLFAPNGRRWDDIAVGTDWTEYTP